MNNSEIKAVLVYLERRTSREFVGRLTEDDGEYEFAYDEPYLFKDTSIPLGPDLPLTKRVFSSKELFVSFLDRLPSKENPAYVDYCQMVGISQDESNPLILLSTLGRKGPSSFIFTPEYEVSFTGEDVRSFRKELDLSIRDFSSLFGLSYSTVSKIETAKVYPKDILKRIKIYSKFPDVALEEVELNRFKVVKKVYGRVCEALKKNRKEKE